MQECTCDSLLQVTQVDHAGIASINISEGLQIQPKDIDYCIMVKPYIKGCRCATILDRAWLEGLRGATIQNSGTPATFDLPLT